VLAMAPRHRGLYSASAYFIRNCSPKLLPPKKKVRCGEAPQPAREARALAGIVNAAA